MALASHPIRIEAPIPGKALVGIEVPNRKVAIIGLRNLLEEEDFGKSKYFLPLALGRDVSGSPVFAGLDKMPHLLIAGATGTGKSVMINTILLSMLYKHSPEMLKLILIDPKRVELSLYNGIPHLITPVITDNKKVLGALKWTVNEMEHRYEQLLKGGSRDIMSYNTHMAESKEPVMPYIIVVIDELADLMASCGREVEACIVRLAQMARAVGIHLVVSTQRPSVEVITGLIKANFPARIAFRVSSKIDSRTILDTQGADQLIGRGDLLYTNGNEVVRVQCAFIDTPEVEKIVDFIGSQKAYPDAYLLPEFVGEDSGINLDMDISERDALFKEAAEIIVTAQQGSASLLQRKLKSGYNRAGRLIDQLEAAGIVGPFEGSKARNVNMQDLSALDQFFNNEQN